MAASVPLAADAALDANLDTTRYAAVAGRDAACDGQFFYGVRTTGVFCKPSCVARTPRPENVVFFTTVTDALAAGFRPCKRCHPERLDGATPQAELHAAVITAVCRTIDQAISAGQPAPTLAALATRTGFSPYHLQRLFTRATGTSPRQYAMAARAARLQQALTHHHSVADAMHAVGYASTSRLQHDATQRLGMTPSRAKAGGAGETIRFAVSTTTLGALLVAATGHGLCAMHLGDDPADLVRVLEARFPNATLIGNDPAFAATVAQVVAFVEAPRHPLDLPLDIRGTAFQQRVWQALMTIPPGATWSYQQLAEAIGQPRAVRAVASACASNDIAVVIPCHRVVRTSGALAGYRWGLARKTALLTREQLTREQLTREQLEREPDAGS